jgi:hypothetical protein
MTITSWYKNQAVNVLGHLVLSAACKHGKKKIIDINRLCFHQDTIVFIENEILPWFMYWRLLFFKGYQINNRIDKVLSFKFSKLLKDKVTKFIGILCHLTSNFKVLSIYSAYHFTYKIRRLSKLLYRKAY